VDANNKLLLQASRGAASLFVLLFHASSMSEKYFHYNLFGVANIGRSGGVDYFFVLTGFLMYSIYHKDIGNRDKVLPFLKNRFIRIYPFYWLVTLIVLPVYFIAPNFGYGYERQKSVIVKSLLLYPQEHGPILPVAWSLTYFVLFYLIISLLMTMKPKWGYTIIAVWAAVTLCNFMDVPVLHQDMIHHYLLSVLFNEVNLEFLAGCLLAYWVMNHKKIKHVLPLLIVGTAGFPFIWLNNKFNFISYHDYALYGVPSVILLLGLSTMEIHRLPKWVAGLSRLGDASYTILLTHLLFISVFMKILRSSHLASKLGILPSDLAIIAVSVPLMYLVYLLVEKPLVSRLKGLNRFRKPSPDHAA
jgi:exopolysaccharide production protein ExoZ